MDGRTHQVDRLVHASEVPEDRPGKLRSSSTEAEPLSIPPPDLEIRVAVETKGGETFLTYLLHSSSDRPGGFHYRTIRGKPIQARPQEYHNALFREIGQLHEGKHIDGSIALEEEIPLDMAALGRKLYRELFPPEMRAAYRAFRASVTTLLITSEEPWIPWELIKPYDDEGPELIDDDFLCIRFQLTRWLSGGLPPAATIGVERLACVDAGQALPGNHLPSTKKERQWLRRLAERHPGIEDRSPSNASTRQVKRCLEEEAIDLLHFVGHGVFEASDPDHSRFYLADGRYLRPLDLHGEIQTRAKRRRPLVFLNACQVGQQSFSLTGLGGWAPRWVTGCGCGALIAPLWPVNDTLAHLFAITFYSALEAGESLGQASQSARRRVRRAAPSRLTWLAFTVYAHPNGRLLPGYRLKPLPGRARQEAGEHDADEVSLIEADWHRDVAVSRDRGPSSRPRVDSPSADPIKTNRTPQLRLLGAALLAVLVVSLSPALYEPELGSMPAHPAPQNEAILQSPGRASTDTAEAKIRQLEKQDSIAAAGGLVRVQIRAASGMPLSKNALEKELVRGLEDRIDQQTDFDPSSSCLVILEFESVSLADLEGGMKSCAFEVGFRLLVNGKAIEEDRFYEIKSSFNPRTACTNAARTIGERVGNRALNMC